MMRKPTGHKERYSIKSEISRVDSKDGTAARTRPFSFDEIMSRRKNKKQYESVEDQGVVSETAYGRVESDRHRRRDVVDGGEEHASKEHSKVVSRMKERIVESEYRESYSNHRRSKVDDDSAKDSRKERGVHEKRKNHDRSTDDFDYEHGKRHGKDYAVKDRDRDKSEHVSKRTPYVYEDVAKKHESRKWHDSTISEKKQKKLTSESRHEELKSRSKRSRSRERREHERDKSKRSKSPSPRGQKQRYYDAREHDELPSHSSKDGKKVSNNGSDIKIKRHDTSASGLGGYSPRKRRSEAAVKTPVLNSRSPEKKNAGWDSPPVKIESSLPSLNKTELSNRHEVSSVSYPITPSILKPTFGVLSSITSTMNVSVDSVQLTQATRPKRRIYVENLPPSASEAAVMQWLTGYLRPFGLTHVQSTSPCISCIVNKEKGQALVEFLTPEDASNALNLDGKSFSGNIVKIRRPKDYVEAKASTGVSEKPVAAAVSVKNVVEDSPNKMFIGGISKVITPEMLMEIASAFGPLKAYHFEGNAHLHSPCAFVEYADQSVTVKACVGLNGMKLGGQVLTVTQATPDASLVGNHGDLPFYGTPVHAQPLLEKPTQVLKLNNVLDPHSLPSLSESELEEILEDIRLECARFGVVKSINIVKQAEMPTNLETIEVTKEAKPVADEATKEAKPEADEATIEANLMAEEVTERSCSDKLQQHEEPTDENNSHTEPEKINGDGDIVSNKHENKTGKDETCNVIETESRLLKVESHETMKNISDLIDAFEVGCVLVEYKRTEASSTAAHCLHGRVFDGRSVSVEYVAYDVYCTRFRK
ncbi:putative RNA recognition motif domain, nucleotide-binding alpha-beta plait domain superfamily [Helianthus debilis subsp. tardiflorus]